MEIVDEDKFVGDVAFRQIGDTVVGQEFDEVAIWRGEKYDLSYCENLEVIVEDCVGFALDGGHSWSFEPFVTDWLPILVGFY